MKSPIFLSSPMHLKKGLSEPLFGKPKKSQNQNGHHLIQKFANLISKPNSINGTCWRGGQKLMAWGNSHHPRIFFPMLDPALLELLVRSMNVTEKLKYFIQLLNSYLARIPIQNILISSPMDFYLAIVSRIRKLFLESPSKNF